MKSRIFVSSVQKELAAERRALKDYILGDPFLGRFFEVFLFEDLSASGRRADEVYLEEVDRCNIYLGIFGNDYGHEDAKGISPTEREFDRATAAAKERLVFIKGDDSRRHTKMHALARKAGNQVVRRRFVSIPELTSLVYSSLVEYLVRAGTIRTRPFDAAACPDATIDDLSRKNVRDFLARAQAERNYPLGPRTPTEKALAHLNLLDRGRPSHAAVLLFGKQPQRFLITSEVKCLQFHGTTVAKPIPDYQIYKGTVFELVDQSAAFVMSKLAAAVGTRAESNRAPVTYEIPRAAVAEAIVNAVAHRDYASNASVQVMLFADRLEIWNPGRLPPSLTPEALRVPHASIPHNPLIAEPLFLTRYIEKVGTGILDMIGLCEAAGLPAPQFRQEGGQFIQTLWRPQRAKVGPSEAKVGTKSALSRHQVEILEKCREETLLVDLMAIAGRVDRTKFRHQVLSPLLAEGLVEMSRPEKPTSRLQKYRITDKGRAWLNQYQTQHGKEDAGK
jgi:predicted transcriptional regulator